MDNIPNIIEAALLLIIIFLIGCIIGWFLRAKIFRRKKVKASAPTQTPTKPAPTQETTSAAPKPAIVSTTPKEVATKPRKAAKIKLSEPADTGKPEALISPRNGKKDDLKKIKGVGPKLENTLNGLGIFHFDQIAAWKSKEIEWVDTYLSFKGRIARDQWIAQAKKLK